MRLLAITHPACSLHLTGPWHPERPERLEAVVRGLEAAAATLEMAEATEVPLEALYLVHDPVYVRAIRDFCLGGGGALDADTSAVADSWQAALRAAGAGLDAVAGLRRGDFDAAFVAVRPPGHHALASRAMGFCLFNNVAVVAAQLAAAGERVAIVDWDVHHGNGTQEMFYRRSDILYISIHEFPQYPGTGWVEETGSGEGRGATLNLPFPSGTSGDVIRAGFDRIVAPVLSQFSPDWVLVSAGYDAHESDPLAGLRLHETDYGYLAAGLAALTPPGRLAFFLEGGYDLEALEGSTAATVRGAGGGVDPDPERSGGSPAAAHRILEVAAQAAAAFWDLD